MLIFLDYPIIISLNKFSNNFAYAFGTSFVFKKNSNDITLSDCVGIYITGNIFMNNVGCPNTYGNVIISCEPNNVAAVSTGNSLFANYYDVLSVQKSNSWATNSLDNYYSFYNFKVNNILETKSDKEVTLERAFNSWLNNKLNTFNDYNGTSGYLTNSYTGQKYVASILIYSENTCSANYAIISNCIYVQGAMGILMESNLFKENSVPLTDFVDLPAFNNNGYKIITGYILKESFETIENQYINYMKESSPVLFRISNWISIKSSRFENNFAVFQGDFYFGNSITFDKTLGRNNITISDCSFKKNQGLPVKFMRIMVLPSFYYDLCSFPLITMNYWIAWKASLTTVGFEAKYIVEQHAFKIENTLFEENEFGLTDQKVIWADLNLVKFYF